MARDNRRKRGWYDAFMDGGIWVLFALLLLPAGVVGYVIGKEQASDEPAKEASSPEQSAAQPADGEAISDGSQIEPAPAFSAEELSEEPKEAWLTNGGTLSNQRYSPLDEIDTDNVDELKGVWMTDLAGSGVAAKYSAEAQPIVYEGVMYVPTGADDVFAVSVETGKVLSGGTRRTSTRRSAPSAAAGSAAASPSATARSTSGSWTERSSRSTRRRASVSGRPRSATGSRATRSPRHPSTTTAW